MIPNMIVIHSSRHSIKVKNLGLVCAALVVCLHLPIPSGKSDFGYYCWQVVQYVASVAVPFFFIFSGYFLSAHFDEVGWYGREVIKRFKSILVPYILWSCIVLLNKYLTNIYRGELLDVNIIKWFGFDLTCMPGAYHLWFLRNLMLLVIVSVLVKKYIDRFRWIGILALYAMCLCYYLAARRCMFLEYEFSIVGLLYFSVGVAFRRLKGLEINNPLVFISIFVSLIFTCLVVMFGFENIRCVLHMGLPFLMILFWEFISEREWNNVRASFPIYLMHIIIQPYAYFMIKHLHLPYLFGFICQWSLCVGIPIVSATLCRRFLPKGTKLLFGGR